MNTFVEANIVSLHHVGVIVNSLNRDGGQALANPPSSNPKQLLSMSEVDYKNAQDSFYKTNGFYSGSLHGNPTRYAHEVRDVLEEQVTLSANQLCTHFMKFYSVAHEDAKSWLAIGLRFSLEDRPDNEKTTEIEEIMSGIVNQRDSVLGLVKKIGDIENNKEAFKASLYSAEDYAIRCDSGLIYPNVEDHHNYSGRIVKVLSNHIVQNVGRNVLVIHDKARLGLSSMSRLNDAELNSYLDIKYKGQFADVAVIPRSKSNDLER